MRSPLLLTVALFAVASGCSAPTPNLAPPRGGQRPGPDASSMSMEELAPFLARNREKDYPLYAGDEIQISVKGRPDLTVERPIPPDGRVPLYGFGTDEELVDVEAGGKRIPDLEKELRTIYARIVPNPYVTVRVTAYAPKVIYVNGEVKDSGEIRLPDDKRISLIQALTKAGWFTENAADDRILVIRVDPETGERIFLPPIDVGHITEHRKVELDIPLDPGDTVHVSSATSLSVFVFGHVEEPGEVTFKRGMTLAQLITRVGGFKEFAKLSNIRVLRDAEDGAQRMFHVDIQAILDGESAAFHLSPGDVIYVDETFI